ncbi:hypothetical protein Hanom_Chr16g01428051 [Helianthus anomalus]
MELIKSNYPSNHSPPLDLAEMKSQPLKLIKITSTIAVQGSFFWPPQIPAMFSVNHAMLAVLGSLEG